MAAPQFTRQFVGNGEYISGEILSLNQRARDTIVLDPTAVPLPSGTVLGKITATGHYVPLNPTANDGSQNWAGHLFHRRDASTATQQAVATVRDYDYNGNKVTYINTMTAAQVAAADAQAAAQRVIARY